MTRVATLCTTMAMLCVAGASSELPWISSSTSHPGSFIDEYGRTVIFHGVSAVQKGFPWYWQDFVSNPSRVSDLQAWGINFVRLGWMWSGYEPVEGQFNETYLKITQSIVSSLADHGIYTMLDMHQDGASSEFCLYDGFPSWLFAKRSAPRHAFPYPLNASAHCDRPWEENFLTEAMGQYFQDLYNNHNGMQTALRSFWEQSARVWKNTSSIAGFELVNEPWAGDVFKDPLLFVPGNAGSKNLMPMYNYISDGVRAIDPNHVLFYEPVTWGMFLEGKILGTGFTTPPGGSQWANKSALSYHYYCPLYQMDQPTKDTKLVRLACDDFLGPTMFDSVATDMKTIGGASMLTEWGECNPTLPTGATECDAVQGRADEHLQSWSWWDYAGHEEYNSTTGQPLLPYVKMMSRTYAQAIAGVPKSMSFNTTTAEFSLCFTLSAAAPSQPLSSTTVIYHNQPVFYPKGATVTTTANLQAAVEGNLIRVTPSSSAAPGGGDTGCVSLSAH